MSWPEFELSKNNWRGLKNSRPTSESYNGKIAILVFSRQQQKVCSISTDEGVVICKRQNLHIENVTKVSTCVAAQCLLLSVVICGTQSALFII